MSMLCDVVMLCCLLYVKELCIDAVNTDYIYIYAVIYCFTIILESYTRFSFLVSHLFRFYFIFVLHSQFCIATERWLMRAMAEHLDLLVF
jgi:hypothetical protein